ncbi:MAG TPA: hypothetical protein VMP00_09025 [Burkholderiales bacterium]|nr:hypothetical protein [Burkholderiales bacterium]
MRDYGQRRIDVRQTAGHMRIPYACTATKLGISVARHDFTFDFAF